MSDEDSGDPGSLVEDRLLSRQAKDLPFGLAKVRFHKLEQLQPRATRRLDQRLHRVNVARDFEPEPAPAE